MDTDMKELRRQLETAEQSAHERADRSGATEEDVHGKLAETEQKLVQKEVGYNTSNRDRFKWQLYSMPWMKPGGN